MRTRGQTIIEFALLASFLALVSIPVLTTMRRRSSDLLYNEVMAVTVPGMNNSSSNTNGDSAPTTPSDSTTCYPGQ